MGKKGQKTREEKVQFLSKVRRKGVKNTHQKRGFGAKVTGKCVLGMRKSDKFWGVRGVEKCILYWFFPGRPF
jgi:predicted GNAT family acetyltransferase